jgi:hypothetical protein
MPKIERFYLSAIVVPDQDRNLTGGFFHGLMDMFRYDGARVIVSNATVIVIRTPSFPTLDRWKSFGIEISTDRISATVETEYRQAGALVESVVKEGVAR